MFNSNFAIAKIFREMAFLLEMKGVAFKPQAYEKAAMNIEGLSEDVAEIYRREGLSGFSKIPGVGKGLAEHIAEYLKTGKVKEREILRRELPIDIEGLSGVEGLGPQKIKALYQKLHIKNIGELERAASRGKIRGLPTFGEKTEKNILESLEFLKRSRGRLLLAEILPTIEEIINNLKKLKEVKNISYAGSLRRRKETIGDADILIAAAPPRRGGRPAAGVAAPKKIFDYFLSTPGIEKVWARGETKVSVRMAAGFDVDIRILPEKSFGAGLQYFTGSKEHNIASRKIAIAKGLKLNEYGLFRGEKMIAGKTEEEIYAALGMAYIEPELRENTGEIEAAQKSNLPKLIELKNILGDLHVHSDWNGGENSIEDLAKEAMRLGYEYIGISDHTKFLAIEHGMDEKQLEKRNKEIDVINSKLKIKNSKFRVLKGCEANIMADGSIDIKDEALAKMDYVIAGVHSQMKMSREEMTQRIIRAMENRNVDIISHPTGRRLQKRDEYEFDFDKILEVARKTGTILEINGSPSRLDLNNINIRKAKRVGIKMIINSDAHHVDQLKLMQYGIFEARRGWAEKKDIINVWPLKKLMGYLKK